MSVHVKIEHAETTEMLSTKKQQYEQLIKDKAYPKHHKIALLTDMILSSKSGRESIEYYKQRCMLYYEEKKYQDTLYDINVLDQYGELNETFLMMKWISSIHFQLGEIRNAISKTFNIGFVHNINDAINLYNSISEAKIDKLIQQNGKNRSSKNIKRLN